MSDDDCTCNWFDMEADPDCPEHFPDPFTEMFPGTLAALDALTIRKATP
jgi:hypothetical protein